MALPFFEEANRTRAFAVTILRELARRGIVGALPDLPGTGESLVPTDQASLENWRAAFGSAGDYIAYHGPLYTASIRSGALVAGHGHAFGTWNLSPVTGADLRRELIRARQASSRESGEAFDPATIDTATAPIELAGNLIAPALLTELATATPSTANTRTVRLETEAKPADHKLPGSPLWRRAEPDNDPDFAALIADDIAQWIAKCAA